VTHAPRQAIPVLIVLVLGVSWWSVETWRGMQPLGPLTASGTVEADEVLVSSEVAGRLVEITTEEGRRVGSGEVVARLDDAMAQLQVSQAVDAAVRRERELQAGRYVLRAPAPGVVTRVPMKVGEVVAPGQTVAAVANLVRLRLTLYVPESALGQVQVGRRLAVTADPFPSRAFDGQVTSINQHAEFTPRNVQTQRDRLNLVFGVRARVENPDGALKPGMPVDATFLE
jgi:HlyD family secretion protein